MFSENNFYHRKSRPNRQDGFTLVELLVVASIIVLLTGVGSTYFESAARKNRDSKRQTDLSSFKSGLELYRSDLRSYPPTWNLNGQANLVHPTVPATIYLNNVPRDPRPAPHPNYNYVPLPSGCTGTNCTSYCIYADFESLAAASIPAGCPAPGGTYDYGIIAP